MNHKLSSLMFVLMTSGCHASQEQAVCPTPEEAAEPEPLPEEVHVEMTPELKAEIKRAHRRIREEVRGVGR